MNICTQPHRAILEQSHQTLTSYKENRQELPPPLFISLKFVPAGPGNKEEGEGS